MMQLYSATKKKIRISLTKRNKDIIFFLQKHGESTLMDVAKEIRCEFDTTLVELKYLDHLGFVSTKGTGDEKEVKKIFKKQKAKTVKKRKRKTKKRELKPKEKYIADLDRWIR